MKEKMTQREWDRVVGIGKVPAEYSYEPSAEADEAETSSAYDRAKEAVDE
jgi:hypothetical protein